ncbi:MAG: acetylglutamate kinase [Rhodospirillaceae bacterium]|nr:acetylglutamate kinase [Rhodospirillaceae bacterium]|tara:strand:- start:5286 stop:6212 length:927 start_codon:yes stop_codon:yes gene_type:complete
MTDNNNQNIANKKRWLRTASTISEALPYLKNFSGHTFVIKYGGHAMGDDSLANNFARDVVLLKHVGINPIVVHGGGPQIGDMLERLGIESKFIDGHRVTDSETMKIAEMVLSGNINKEIVSKISAVGGKAIGLSGKDGNLITCRKLKRKVYDSSSNTETNANLGFVGEPKDIEVNVLKTLAKSDFIPVVAPIGIGIDGKTYNINADTCAGAIASAMSAAKLIMMTDVPGVLDSNHNLINHMNTLEAKKLLDNAVVSDGMIPKVETCINAIEQNVGAAHILDGRVTHVLLLEIFTEHGTGTMLKNDAKN